MSCHLHLYSSSQSLYKPLVIIGGKSAELNIIGNKYFTKLQMITMLDYIDPVSFTLGTDDNNLKKIIDNLYHSFPLCFV